MKKFVLILFGAFALSTSAQAAVYNFAVSAANEGAFQPYTDGNLTVNAGSSVGGTDYWAYLDGPSGQTQVGGLGVCQTNNCAGSPDDNHQKDNEFIMMELSNGEEGFYQLNIQGNHAAVVQDTFLNYRLDGVAQTAIDISGLTLQWVALAANSATKLEYWITNTSRNAEIYVAALTTVPVPAAFWLFGTALIGFISMARKVKV